MKDNVVVTTAASTTPASPKLTAAVLQPVTWAEEKNVYWAPDGKGGIQIVRKPPTMDEKAAAQSTADTAPTATATTTTPDRLKAPRWWTTLNGWREKTYHAFIIVAKFIVTAINWLTAALSFGKVKQLISWGAKNTDPSDSAVASNDPGPDFVTGNYDALTIAADAASKLPPPAIPKETASFQPRGRSTPK